MGLIKKPQSKYDPRKRHLSYSIFNYLRKKGITSEATQQDIIRSYLEQQKVKYRSELQQNEYIDLTFRLFSKFTIQYIKEMAKRQPKATKEPLAHVEAPAQISDPAQFNGIRSMYAVVQNFKNIENKLVNIGGKSLLVLGGNAEGKSSLLQALKGSLLSEYRPAEGLMQGAEHGFIRHRIAGNINGEYHDYTIEIYFDEKDRAGRLKLIDASGAEVKSPASKLKQIIGNVSFDVMSWMHYKKPERLKLLKQLTGRGQEIDLINIDIKAKNDQKKAKLDRAAELEAILNNHGMSKEEIEHYSKPIPIEPINERMTMVAQAQSQFDNVKAQADTFLRGIEDAQRKIQSNADETTRILDEIARLQNKITALSADNDTQRDVIQKNQNNVVEAEKWMRTYPRPDIGLISQELANASTHNAKTLQINTLSEQHKEMNKLKREAEAMMLEINALVSNRNNIIATSQLPVEGLSFDDEEIYLNGLPFDDQQINTQRQIHVSVQIAKALNPNYRGIFIDDGSLLDEQHLKALVEEIEKDNQYYAIIEMVSYKGGETEVQFTEEVLK